MYVILDDIRATDHKRFRKVIWSNLSIHEVADICAKAMYELRGMQGSSAAFARYLCRNEGIQPVDPVLYDFIYEGEFKGEKVESLDLYYVYHLHKHGF